MEFGFIVETRSKDIIFAADSLESREKWTQGLTELLANKFNNSTPVASDENDGSP